MAKQKDALRAGIFMVLSFLAIIVVIVAIKGFARVFMPSQVVKARFKLTDDLGGLNRGDNVRIGGYTVGSVEAIKIVANQKPPYIQVVLTMPKQYTLRQGAYLSIGGTVTGTSWLNFRSLGAGKPLPKGTIIEGHGGGLVSEVAKLSAIFPDVVAIVHSVRATTVPRINQDLLAVGPAVKSINTLAVAATGTIHSVQARIPHLVRRYDAVTGGVTAAMDQATKFLHSGRKGAVSDINDITAEVKKAMPGIVAGIQVNLKAMHVALVSAQKTAGDANSLLSANQHRVSRMLQSLNGASANLKAFAIEIRHSPWRLLYRPGKAAQANMELYDAVREFNNAARNLSETSLELRRLLKVGVKTPAEQKQLTQYMQVIKASFQHFSGVQKKFWSLVKQ